MALKELRKPKSRAALKEAKVKKFISKGGTLALDAFDGDEQDHRLTLRIPKALMAKVDLKRKKRIGKISRNLWILEILDKATQK